MSSRTSKIKLTDPTPLILDAVSSTTGSLKGSAGADVTCDKYIVVDVDGTDYYLPLYDTLN